MEVEDKQQLCSFESHDFVSLMFPAYISLNTNEPYTDYSDIHLTVQISVYKVVIMIYNSAWSFINDWTVTVKWFLQQYERIWCDARIEVLKTLLLNIQVFCDIRNCHSWCFQGSQCLIFRAKQSILQRSIDKVGKSKHNKTLLRYRSRRKTTCFGPFIIRPSSGLTWRTKEESQCYMVHKCIICYI
jgi:hypothetical protein